MIIIVRNISWCYLQTQQSPPALLLSLHSCSPASITFHYLSFRLDPIWERREMEADKWHFSEVAQLARRQSRVPLLFNFNCCSEDESAGQSVPHQPHPTPPSSNRNSRSPRHPSLMFGTFISRQAPAFAKTCLFLLTVRLVRQIIWSIVLCMIVWI